MKSSLFRRLLLYNVLILLVPIWVGSFIHVKTVKVVAEKSSQAHMASLKRSKTILDERLGEVERLALQILANDRVRRLSGSHRTG